MARDPLTIDVPDYGTFAVGDDVARLGRCVEVRVISCRGRQCGRQCGWRGGWRDVWRGVLRAWRRASAAAAGASPDLIVA